MKGCFSVSFGRYLSSLGVVLYLIQILRVFVVCLCKVLSVLVIMLATRTHSDGQGTMLIWHQGKNVINTSLLTWGAFLTVLRDVSINYLLRGERGRGTNNKKLTHVLASLKKKCHLKYSDHDRFREVRWQGKFDQNCWYLTMKVVLLKEIRGDGGVRR